MGDAGALLRAGRINALKHLRIDGGFIVREEEFQVARCGICFRFREPVTAMQARIGSPAGRRN